MVATEPLSWVTGWAGASGQKSALGGRAILQAVTRVKLKQASKVKLWMPTRLLTGEGRADREEYRHAPVRSAGVLSTACKKGDLGNWGRSGAGGGRTSLCLSRPVKGTRIFAPPERKQPDGTLSAGRHSQSQKSCPQVDSLSSPPVRTTKAGSSVTLPDRRGVSTCFSGWRRYK